MGVGGLVGWWVGGWRAGGGLWLTPPHRWTSEREGESGQSPSEGSLPAADGCLSTVASSRMPTGNRLDGSWSARRRAIDSGMALAGAVECILTARGVCFRMASSRCDLGML